MRVNTIEFNYDTANGFNLPLNLRYNYRQEINLPEYSFKVKRNCPVCYRSGEVNDKLIIKVSFEDEDKSFNGMYLDIRGLAYDESKNILGTTQTHKVGFINGYSQGGSIDFNLKSNKINNFSAGKFDCCYKWQYKEESETWTDFDRTEHTVYVIPHTSLSKLWETDSFSSNYVPWAEALDFVCSELNCFSETVSDDEISEHIAKWINGGNFEYDNDGESNYSAINCIGETLYPIFNAEKFLNNYSKASSSNKMRVNCNDCACINTFFLSLLGINNEVSYISSDISLSGGFKCNEVISIGNTEWHIPFYNESEIAGIFSYHAVCGYEKGTLITDSCLKIDFGENPWSTGDPSGASKRGEVACKTTFADPATIPPDNLPKTPYTLRFYRERLCDMASLTANLCKVVSTSEYFEFTTAIYKFHMVGKKLINKHLKMYSNDFLKEGSTDTEEKFYSFDSIKTDNGLKVSTSYINDEKNFCELIPESEEYKGISAELYICDDFKTALSCLDSLIFDNAGGFAPDNELSVDCNIAMKSLSGKIITAVKKNVTVKIKTKNNAEVLTEFTKKFLSLFD